ncbi:metal-dependent hydrolase [Jeotgalibacillus proteolyticus]|uniref:Metal-dependent hydrolase n=1 Tax=Jeotgalibacillus proteolyticus TaxID=2082395 RepID=A0A2S5GG69_9BACL|nr:metal-dependent hydrolase [Jeotgalibacillus proteolyticus]PPA71863.1 metal-dependent hydrolase [Jeotgalibacillus proteolyticus]
MKGTSHALVGAVAGLGIAVWQETAPAATGLLITLGCISALAPDLDTNGKLSNRISLHRKWLWFTLGAVGVLLGTYSLIMLDNILRLIGVGVALLLIIVPRYIINQRFMIFLSGAALIFFGALWEENWVICFGLFTAVSAFLPHRGLTHSIVGLITFGGISFLLEESLGIQGIIYACTAGYLSHLILDMKCLPFNKKGVKWFQPLWKKEF